MIGTQFFKDSLDDDAYASCADWCNESQQATIEDMGDYYECVAIPPPQAPTEAELIELYKGYAQDYIDETARTRDYTDGNYAVGYANSPADSKFGREGRAFVTFRDAVWNTCYSLLGLVKSGQMQIPTQEDFLAMLPKINWGDDA